MKLHKETKVHGRWYDDACGTAFALELIGERWALLVVRELMLGPRRFSDIRASLPGISAKVLTERLATLAEAGVLRRGRLPPPAAAQVYELTEWGYLAEEPIKALGFWAAQSPCHDPALPLSAVSLILSLRTMFDSARAGGLSLRGSILIAGESFAVEVMDARLRAGRGAYDQADFTLSAPAAPVIAALVYGKAPAAKLAEAGLAACGDLQALASFVDLFHLPEKVH